MTFHKEGHTSLALCILLIFVVNAFIQFYFPGATGAKWLIYILSFVFFLATLLFFRNPSIDINPDEKAVLSPADGKIVAIEEVEEAEYLKDRRILVSIAIAPTDVHVNRNPVKGVVKYFATDSGRTSIVVESIAGSTILLQQIAGFTKRVVAYLKQGDVVEQGVQFGFSMLGSRVNLFLPIGTNINVAVGDVVKGGKTVLAQLKS